MKKIFLFAAIAALTLTGCSKDQNVEKSDSDVIGFRAVSGKSTKGTSIDGTNFLGFRVFAYQTASGGTIPGSGVKPDFMYDVAVTRAAVGDNFAYSPAKYWPSNGNVHFYAYGPATTAATFATASGVEGQPVINFSVNASVAAQEDLIWAKMEGRNKTNTGTNPVNFTFAHALSQVVFQAKSGAEALKFNITKVELVTVKNAGSFNLKNGAWVGAPTGTATYGIDGTMLANNTNIDNTAFVNLTGTNGAMMVMPQTLTAGTASPVNTSSGTYIRITFGAKDGDVAIVEDGSTYTVPFGGFDLEQNKRYVIQMTLSGNSDGSGEPVAITFSGTVSDWETPDVTKPIGM